MRKRNHVIPVRLNTKELKYLDEQVKKSGISREEHVRTLIMGAEVHAITWFKGKNKWQGRNYTPSAGTLIFFDWPKNGVRDGFQNKP